MVDQGFREPEAVSNFKLGKFRKFLKIRKGLVIPVRDTDLKTVASRIVFVAQPRGTNRIRPKVQKDVRLALIHLFQYVTHIAGECLAISFTNMVQDT